MPCRAGPTPQNSPTANELVNPSATTPTEQQFYDALSPDLKRKVDEARALKAGAREEMAKASQDKLNTIRVGSRVLLLFLHRSPMPRVLIELRFPRKRRRKLGAKRRYGQMQLRRTPRQSDDAPSLVAHPGPSETSPTLHLHLFELTQFDRSAAIILAHVFCTY